MAPQGNTKRDSTRILSNLSGDSRVVPARAKSAFSRKKILASLTVLIMLIGATIWSARNMQRPATSPSLSTTIATTQPDTPTQTTPDFTTLALPALSEPQAALIENVPVTKDDTSKNGVSPQIIRSGITASEKPFAALTEDATQPAKINDAKLVDKTAKADQKIIPKNTAKKGTPASRPRKAEDDADVTILTALIESTEPPASAKKAVSKKIADVGERLKSCEKLGKKEAVRCSQEVCEGQAGKNSACQKFSIKK